MTRKILLFLMTFSLGVSAFAAQPLVIVALGDSTTAGTPGYQPSADPRGAGSGNEKSQYAYWIMRRHPEWMVLNRGINGQRTDQIARRFETDVKANHPQIMIVLAGVNDLFQGTPVQEIKDNLQKLYQQALAEGVKVMALTILPYDKSTITVQDGMKDVNQWIQTYASQHGLGFCDTHAALRNPNLPSSLISTADGLHPDVAAYKKMGETINACLESWLQ